MRPANTNHHEGGPLLVEEERRLTRAAARVAASVEDLDTSFRDVALRLASLADRLVQRTAERELRAPPVLDLDEIVARLERNGPSALSRREQRVLVSSPERLAGRALDRLLAAQPGLVRHAARVCVRQWPGYVHDAWGEVYGRAVLAQPAASGLRALRGGALAPAALLSRRTPRGDVALAAALPVGTLVEAYDYLRSEVGLRDTWLLLPSVLVAWLQMRVARSKRIDDDVIALQKHSALSSLLLPPERAAKQAAPVRTTLQLQAETVATLLDAAFEARLLSRPVWNDLASTVLRSTFDDPRSSVRSEGWELVKRLSPAAFQQLLTTLSEQDLEVFFNHAMDEPDRRAFWLRYVGAIERTGCVLDAGLRDELQAKVADQPAMRGAFERAFIFSRRSGVQAFFMLFSEYAIVEFSEMGNAAYVYKRSYFTEKLEPQILRKKIEGVSSLKIGQAAVDRISHGVSWEERTQQRLAELGVHARK